MEKLKKQKLKSKEKKKANAKVEEKTNEPVTTVDLNIPVQVYLVQVNKPNYKSKITADEVRNDFKYANNIWNKKGFNFEIVEIIKVDGNYKKLDKDLKWIDKKYVKSLTIDRKKQTIKAKNEKKYFRIKEE